MMTIESLKTLHEARPFHPFVIHLPDGRSHRVSRPTDLAYPDQGPIAVVFERDATFHVIDLRLVQDIGVEHPTAHE